MWSIWKLELRQSLHSWSFLLLLLLFGSGIFLLHSFVTNILQSIFYQQVPYTLLSSQSMELWWEMAGLILILAFTKLSQEIYTGRAKLIILHSSRRNYYFGSFLANFTYWLILISFLMLLFSYLDQRFTAINLLAIISTLLFYLGIVYFLSIIHPSAYIFGYILGIFLFLAPMAIAFIDLELPSYLFYFYLAFWYRQPIISLRLIPAIAGITLLLIGYYSFQRKDL